MKKNIYISTIFCCILLTACEKNMSDISKSEPLKIALTQNEVQMVAENNNFAVDFFTTLYNDVKDDKENIIVSPFSLSIALAMVWNGAENETKQAIQEAMGMGSYPQSEVNSYFNKLVEAFLSTDPSTKLAIANSIWTGSGFPVHQSFYDINKKWYKAEVKEVDFSLPETLVAINKWCSDNTKGLIPKIFEKIPEQTVMCLINALYFKGIWAEKFDVSNTKKMTFYKEDGSNLMIDMMYQNSKFKYYSDNDYFSSAILPYGNGAFSMVITLPNENVSFDAVFAELKNQPDYFKRALNSFKVDMDLYLPKFKIEYDEILNEVLKQLGMGLAFNSELADFSGISNIGTFISQVFQKTYIDVNEQGTEAAAVTVIRGEFTSSGKVTFRVDRPFLFSIMENSTGTVLFMGKVGNPK
jgi:serpin B